jgi:hypothetical protein
MAVAFCAFCIVSCGAAQTGTTGGSALLAIHGAPSEAFVSVDGVPLGAIERTGGAYLVSAEASRLEMVAPGFLPYWTELQLVAGEAYDLSLELWPCFEEVDDVCPAFGVGVLETFEQPVTN